MYVLTVFRRVVMPRRQTGFLLAALGLLMLAGHRIQASVPVAMPEDNQIILPSDGQVVVNFVSTSASCTGDFGLYLPYELLIFPDYLYYAGLPFQVPGFFAQGTELVFYIVPGGFCGGNRYLSTDPSRALISHPDPNIWVIAWEDYNDGDFNDLIVQVDFQSSVLPFLDLPYDYAGSTFGEQSRDTEQGGKVNAYFDHQYPTYCSAPNTGGCSPSDLRAVNFRGYDGDPDRHDQPPYRVTYNGHDGFDFWLSQGVPVLAASSGVVTFAGGITTVCEDGSTKTANVIKVAHPNGYTTEYWHLSGFAPGIAPGTSVERDAAHPIGYVGSTGCSTGPHLHFMVRNPEGEQVDPYGWAPVPDAAWYGQDDPWEQYNASFEPPVDATSHYLWTHELSRGILVDPSAPTEITSTVGGLTATIPAGAYGEPLMIELAEGLQSVRIEGTRTARTFALFGYTVGGVPVTTLNAAVTLEIELGGGGSQAMGLTSVPTPTLQLWDAQGMAWQVLPITWDPVSGSVQAETPQIGTFAVTVPEHKVYLPVVLRDGP